MCKQVLLLGFFGSSTSTFQVIDESTGLFALDHHYPEAIPVASELAAQRIAKQSRVTAQTVDALVSHLPEHIRLVAPEGLKNGEIWLLVRASAECFAIVGDAYMSLPGPFVGLPGAALRATNLGPGVRVSRTWPLLHQRSKKAYRAWLESTVEAMRPTTLIPCHGDILPFPK